MCPGTAEMPLIPLHHSRNPQVTFLKVHSSCYGKLGLGGEPGEDASGGGGWGPGKRGRDWDLLSEAAAVDLG